MRAYACPPGGWATDADHACRASRLRMSAVPHLVLAGCGHAHLFVLEALARGAFPPVRVTLISPAEEYFYSGMESGITAGQYRPDEARFQPRLLARAAGAEWVCSSVVGVDTAAAKVVLSSGFEIAYDLLSLNVGARLQGDDLPGVARYACAVKPVRDAISLGERAASMARERRDHGAVRIVIVGGGAAGFETALCLGARLRQTNPPERFQVTVVDGGDRVLAEHPEAVQRRGRDLLRERGVQIRLGVRAEAVDDFRVHTGRDTEIPYDVLVWATGPRAPGFLRKSGLPVSETGYVLVQSTLEAEGRPAVFAAGDCAHLVDHPTTPKAGVYAVREGPVLARNLARRLRGEPLETYRPQDHWLSLLNTGDGQALMSYRGYAARGRPLWWLKNTIDRRFMRRFQELESEASAFATQT